MWKSPDNEGALTGFPFPMKRGLLELLPPPSVPIAERHTHPLSEFAPRECEFAPVLLNMAPLCTWFGGPSAVPAIDKPGVTPCVAADDLVQ